jgi:hypothetical protein
VTSRLLVTVLAAITLRPIEAEQRVIAGPAALFHLNMRRRLDNGVFDGRFQPSAQLRGGYQGLRDRGLDRSLTAG